MNLDDEIDGLYALPLPEFVAARNALAKQLRAGGDREAAAGVKGLPKPSLSAWAVNQLRHHRAEDLEALLAAGERLREAQLADPEKRQQAVAERRRVLARLLEIADGFLAAAGSEPGRAQRQRIARSLEALSAYPGDDPDRPRAGRLLSDVEPPGFGALGALQASLSAGAVAKGKPGKKPPAAARARRPARKAPKSTRPRAQKKASSRPPRPTSQARLERTGLEQQVEKLEKSVADAERESAESGGALEAAKKDLKAAEALAIEARERARVALEEATAARQRVAAARREHKGRLNRRARAEKELEAAAARLADLGR